MVGWNIGGIGSMYDETLVGQILKHLIVAHLVAAEQHQKGSTVTSS